MNQIENVLLPNDVLLAGLGSSSLERDKLGEVFREENNYIFVCFHCSQEFHRFGEFTLHAQDHYMKVFNGLVQVKEEINDCDYPLEAIEPIEVIKNEDRTNQSINSDIDSDYSMASPSNSTFGDNNNPIIFEPTVTVTENIESKQKTNKNMIEDKMSKKTIIHKPMTGKSKIRRKMTLKVNNKGKTNSINNCVVSFSEDKKSKSSRKKVKNSVEPDDHTSPPNSYKEGEDFKVVGFDDKFECLRCNKVIKGRPVMLQHLHTHFVDKKVYCPLCMKQYAFVAYVRIHILRHHGQRLSNGLIREAQRSLGNPELMEPINEPSKKLVINRPRRNTTTFIEKRDFVEIEQSVYKCEYCEHITKSLPTIKEHLKIHFSSASWYCPLCSKRFAFIDYVKRHLARFHNKNYSNKEIRDAQNSIKANISNVKGNVEEINFDSSNESCSDLENECLTDYGTSKSTSVS